MLRKLMKSYVKEKYVVCSECRHPIPEYNMSKENPSICLDCQGEKTLGED